MIFEWMHYLRVAEEFLTEAKDSPNEQALLRSAISRAYYAAFHHALAYLNDPNLNHTTLKLELNRRRETWLFNKFDRMYRNRKWADYRESRKFTSSDAAKVIKEAREVISRVTPSSKS
jgi:uncharacterized protein (UPF0332 family)